MAKPGFEGDDAPMTKLAIAAAALAALYAGLRALVVAEYPDRDDWPLA